MLGESPGARMRLGSTSAPSIRSRAFARLSCVSGLSRYIECHDRTPLEWTPIVVFLQEALAEILQDRDWKGSAMTIKPFKIAIDPRAIDDLKQRLAATRWPESLEVDDWT